MEPDGHTLVHLLSVCSDIQDVEMDSSVHWYIEINGVNVDAYEQNALLDMYAKCGKLSTAGFSINRMVDKNVVTWNSMITACAKHGLIDLARDTFNKMPMRIVFFVIFHDLMSSPKWFL